MKKFSIFNFQFSISIVKRLLRHSINSWSRNDKGFTLIELVVVFAILFIGSVAGIASFRSFGDAKKLDTSASEVESVLNNARINAVTQTLPKPPVVCVSPLQRYSVRITPPTDYEIDAYCNGVRSLVKAGKLPTGIIFSAADEVSFRVATGVSTAVGNKTITLMPIGGGASKQIIVDTAGNITKQ